MRKKKTNKLKVNFNLPSTLSAVSTPALMAGLAWTFNYSIIFQFNAPCSRQMHFVLPVAPKTTFFSLRLRLSTLLSAPRPMFSLCICTCTVCHCVAMNDGAATLAAALQALAVPRLLMWYQLLPAPGDKPPVTPDCHVNTLVCWFKNFFGGKNNIAVTGLPRRYIS